MRTTLELDDRVLAVARSLAASRRISLGEAVSELARRGIQADTAPSATRVDHTYSPFPVLVGDPDVVVTDALVAELRDA